MAKQQNQTPKMLFTKEFQQLKAEGERWMKETANACTIAVALIATIVFAAAFTVPGGMATETGIPIFWNEFAFVLFAISDAVSLLTSITSHLMFLSILTSFYAEEDFLYVLPKRLSIGLLSLFIPITSMMAAFSATLFCISQKSGMASYTSGGICLLASNIIRVITIPPSCRRRLLNLWPWYGKKSDLLLY